jgi:RNA-dependent RNA polymerase
MVTDTLVKKQTEEVTETRIVDVCIDIMSSNMLGQIANVHMALCDLRVLGPRDPDCKELALQHFIEVDAPKTGKKGTIARDLIPNAYPHFMEKGDKQSYLSVKVLGQLYDFCSSVPLDHSILPSTDSVDPRFLVNDYEKYLQSAQNTADAYRLEITALMKLYGIQEESQLITGCLTELPLHLRDERHQISRDVMKQFKEISNRYKKLTTLMKF